MEKMNEILNEKVVMQFYLEEMEKGNVDFLEKKKYIKDKVKDLLQQMLLATTMNEKIQIATSLWKSLFEASMSYIDPEKQGYTSLFSYFDEYVEFEELIFASDSFYRDHTLHCLWVYFLGEYIKRRTEYDALFEDQRDEMRFANALKDVFIEMGLKEENDVQKMISIIEVKEMLSKCDAAFRCVSALTHDLGYPLKKIEKINKSIRKVMPYYSINEYEEFSFNYNNLQQQFLSSFLDILCTTDGITIKCEGVDVLEELFVFEKEKIVGVNKERVHSLSQEEIDSIRKNLSCSYWVDGNEAIRMAYANDMEDYKHGIMSAYLLAKNLRAFQTINLEVNFENVIRQNPEGFIQLMIKGEILKTISNHTSDNYRIQSLNKDAYLTFIDELEEFSRLSRASQSREYVQEFCRSNIYMKEDWLNIDFIFDNDQLDNLDPERAFKGRCKRFLTLFEIPSLSKNIKIRLNCIAKIPNDQNCYTLELARKYADIMINGESQSIPKYLKSNEFYSKEEYMEM